jgi:hypothetical protein
MLGGEGATRTFADLLIDLEESRHASASRPEAARAGAGTGTTDGQGREIRLRRETCDGQRRVRLIQPTIGRGVRAGVRPRSASISVQPRALPKEFRITSVTLACRPVGSANCRTSMASEHDAWERVKARPPKRS